MSVSLSLDQAVLDQALLAQSLPMAESNSWPWWAWLLVAIAVLIIIAIPYNRLVRLRNDWRNAWAQIDVQLKRRHDLVPNLVATVQGYAAHEKETLSAVMQARSGAEQLRQRAQADPVSSLAALGQAEGTLGLALGRLYAVSEAYPELKADSQFAELRASLEHTEDRIGFARQAYNDAVTLYATVRESIPYVFIASILGFAPIPLWQIVDDAERQVPQVRF